MHARHWIAAASVLAASTVWAALAPPEAARLGRELTPLGADPAGNSDGTIPPWTGGIKSAADAGFPNYRSPQHHPDPFANEKPLFKISAANMDRYALMLTEGHKALLKAYPGNYFLNVYPTHRTAAYPQRIYDATKRISTTAHLTAGGNGVAGAVEGIPFPIPKQGVEVFWNHILRYRGNAVQRKFGQAPIQAGGDYTLVKFTDETFFPYHQPGAQEATLDNIIGYFIQETTAPARLAGEILLVHETLDQAKENRKAWIYNPGQRRVRRAPNVAFDNPGTNADNLRTSDQFDMYNGSPERYDWKLVGKQEMYVPYNSYKLQSNQVKYSDLLKPKHINQDYARYELHRVWIVDSTIKAGTSHVYARRTLYVDEDSWQILAVDCYDQRGHLYRVQEGHPIVYYEMPLLWTTLELVMDLTNGRYLALGLQNEEAHSYDFSIKRNITDYSPNELRTRGVR